MVGLLIYVVRTEVEPGLLSQYSAWLRTGRPGFDPQERQRIFLLIPCVQTHPASCTMGTGGPFLGDKARPGRDADHSPSSNAEVKND
jgi:hypothetical protein